MAAGGLDDNICLHRRDGLGLVALEDLVRAHGPGYLQRTCVHVHSHDPPCAGPFEDGHRQRADGSAADHECRLAHHVAGTRDGVPRDAGRFHQRRGPQLQALGQGPEHPGRKSGVPAERPVGVGEACGAAQVRAVRGKIRTVRGIPGDARAGRGRMHRDSRARPRPGAVAGRHEHRSHDLVAQDHRLPEDRLAGRAMHPVVQVRAADAAERHFDHRFIGSRCGHGYVLNPEVACRMGHHGGRCCRKFRDAAHQTTTVIPPSMKMVWPLTKSEPSDASHTAGPARSCTVPHRCAGVRPRIQALNSSSSTRFCVISVWM